MTTYYITDSQAVFAGEAQIDPYAPLPPGTLTPPPQTSGHEVAKWAGGEWSVLPAYPAPAGPTPEQLREIAKAVMVDAIKAERDRRKFNGVKVGAKWIHTDTYSRTQWIGMVMMGASIPAIEWTTMDGTSVTTSQAFASQVFQGTAQLDAALFGYAKMLITQFEAAADPASVDIVTGWPATFEPA